MVAILVGGYLAQTYKIQLKGYLVLCLAGTVFMVFVTVVAMLIHCESNILSGFNKYV